MFCVIDSGKYIKGRTDMLLEILDDSQRSKIEALRRHVAVILDHGSKFKYFTLHGSRHIENMIFIAGLFIKSGVDLNNDEAFLLASSICLHDVGMIATLANSTTSAIFLGSVQLSDPANIEKFIRDNHHHLISEYIEKNYNFLTALGYVPSEIAIIQQIGTCHRKFDLTKQHGHVKTLGALVRLIDELDINPNRAPLPVLLQEYRDWDSVSVWHWFKHNIVEEWKLGHNVHLNTFDGIKCIDFEVIVHPPTVKSVPYWSRQIIRPLFKVLVDEHSRSIISQKWNVNCSIKDRQDLSVSANLGSEWGDVEKVALSSGRKTILVIDDEVRKMEDLFLSLSDSYYIMYSSNPRDAFEKLAATNIDLAIVDMQISGGGGMFSAEETNGFKTTGSFICKKIKQDFPDTLIGVLTGTRHAIEPNLKDECSFFLKKPIRVESLEKEIKKILN